MCLNELCVNVIFFLKKEYYALSIVYHAKIIFRLFFKANERSKREKNTTLVRFNYLSFKFYQLQIIIIGYN